MATARSAASSRRAGAAQGQPVEALVRGSRVDRFELPRDRQRQVLRLCVPELQQVVERPAHQPNSASPT